METIKMLVMSPDGTIDEVKVLADSIESVIKQFGSWEIAASTFNRDCFWDDLAYREISDVN